MGGHDRGGVPIESDDERRAVVLERIGERLPDHLLVAEVDPVEKADGQADGPPAGELSSLGDNFHSAMPPAWAASRAPVAGKE